jgi:AbiV family abortive infection protein
MKKERNLLKLLSKEECYDAYKHSFETANIHKVSANSIALNGHYGTAVSHLILGTEELTKGLLLFIESFGLEVRKTPSIHLFFTDHILKHQFAIYFNMLYPAMKLFMGFIKKKREEIHNPGIKQEYSSMEKAIMSKNEKRVRPMFKDLPEMFDWWDEANKMKNKGFYVDYSTCLETPMQVEKNEYLQAVNVTEIYKKQLDELISLFENFSKEERIEISENAKAMSISKLLSPIIEARKQQRTNEQNPIIKL